MKDEGLNTVSLGKALNIDYSVIARFLRAERQPTLQSLVKIADYFQVSTDYLYGKADSSPASFRKRPPFDEQFKFLLDYFKTNKYRIHTSLNISSSVINGWANGKHEPSTESAIRLAEYFCCSLDFVIGREV